MFLDEGSVSCGDLAPDSHAIVITYTTTAIKTTVILACVDGYKFSSVSDADAGDTMVLTCRFAWSAWAPQQQTCVG